MRRRRYLDPKGRYTGGFGAPWRRGAAAAIDWALCYVAFLLVSIPLGAVQALGDVSWEEGDLGGLPGHILVIATQLLTVAPTVAYFAALLPTSQTFGMRALELHTVSTSTGRAPSRLLAVVRGSVATVGAAGVYLVFMYATSFDRPDRLDEASVLALNAAYLVAGVAGVSALAMLLTPAHRSLSDRLFRTAVLDELEAVAPQMGPWGPLDAFDLSHDGEVQATRSTPTGVEAKSGSTVP